MVAPASIATGIPTLASISEAGAARLGPFRATIQTVATSEELPASITFLLNNDAVNINGALFASDGGWSTQ